MILELLRSDGSVTVNKSLIQAIGLNEAVLYCELLSRYFYFESKQMLDDEGCFFNTQYDLQAGTGLGEKAQRTAISNLKSLGLIEVKVKGMPAKRHFKIVLDEKQILFLLKKGKEKLKSLENSTDTSIGGNLKRQRQELVVAEGSANNTYNNTKSIILNIINVVASDEDNSNRNFFNHLFDYYLTEYKNHMSKEHPLLSKKYVKQIIDNITNFARDYEITSLSAWQEMIDMYFKSNLDCDRNMIHFAQEEILYNRASNCNLI